MPPPEPSPLEAHTGFWLRLVSNQVSGSFRRLVEGEGASLSEWVALRRLYGTSATSTELVEALGMTKGAVSKLLDRLEARGLVRPCAGERDLRVRRVELTPAGDTLVQRLATLADENDRRFFGHLPDDTRDALVAVLRDLARTHALATPPID